MPKWKPQHIEYIGQSLMEVINLCNCSCCAEARNRRDHDREDWRNSCNCINYPEEERCDCVYCEQEVMKNES